MNQKQEQRIVNRCRAILQARFTDHEAVKRYLEMVEDAGDFDLYKGISEAELVVDYQAYLQAVS